MANEIEIVVSAKDRSGPGIESARRRNKDLGRSYAETGKAGVAAFAAIRASLRQTTTSVATSMQRVQSTIRGKLGDAVGDADASGRSIGRRLVAGIVSNIAAGASRIKSTLADVTQGAIKSLASTPVVGAAVVALVGAIAAALGPALGTLLAGSLVLGVGGAVTAIGVMLLSQNAKVKKEWSATWTELKKTMTDAAKPLIPVMETARKQLKSVVGELAPEIEKGFLSAQKPMQRFVKNLGDGFKNLAPAIEPLFDAFGKVLDELGPMLPGLFSDIEGAFTDLAKTVRENADLFAMVFTALLKSIPAVISLVSVLGSAFRTVLLGAGTLLDGVLNGLQSLMEAIAKIPGQEWAADIAGDIAATRRRLAEWKNDVENFPREVKLEGNITDLQAKIREAKKRLKDPKLTRPERAKIQGDITRLKNAVALAKAALASIRNKRVVIEAVARTGAAAAQLGALYGRYGAQASGGLVGGVGAGSPRRMASGGQSGSSMTLVGEQGPELVRLPFGSSVTPSGQTRAMLAGGGGFGRGTVVEVKLTVDAGATTGLERFVAQLIAKYVRTTGGNVQRSLGQHR